jgi:hypothetical protein
MFGVAADATDVGATTAIAIAKAATRDAKTERLRLLRM